jgi:hypothetical protein
MTVAALLMVVVLEVIDVLKAEGHESSIVLQLLFLRERIE